MIERSIERPAVGAAELTRARAETVEKIAVVNRMLATMKGKFNSEQVEELKSDFDLGQCSWRDNYCSRRTSFYIQGQPYLWMISPMFYEISRSFVWLEINILPETKISKISLIALDVCYWYSSWWLRHCALELLFCRMLRVIQAYFLPHLAPS